MSHASRTASSPSVGIARATKTRGLGACSSTTPAAALTSTTAEASDEPTDPVERLGQVLARVGVRDPDVLVADPAERRSGEDAHVDLGQQALSHLGTGEARAADVGEGVERSERRRAFDAVDLVQAG